MKTALFLVFAISLATPLPAADPTLVDGVSGAPLAWSDWVAKRGPVAVLVWASWVPDAGPVVADYKEFSRISGEAGLHLVLLDVQESLADGRKALGESGVNWIHDRHGSLLKLYRVIKVPSIFIVAADGSLVKRLEATPEALQAGVDP